MDAIQNIACIHNPSSHPSNSAKNQDGRQGSRCMPSIQCNKISVDEVEDFHLIIAGSCVPYSTEIIPGQVMDHINNKPQPVGRRCPLIASVSGLNLPTLREANYASASAGSAGSSGCLRPPIHLRTESIKTITAAVMIRTVSEVLM